MIRFIDLFAGIGGFRLALESLGAKCVFSSEIDKYCRLTYEANFGEVPSGYIQNYEAMDIPYAEILCAGFPCQSFSIAGLRLGLADPRGNLFDEIIRIADDNSPKVLFLENVRGLLSHDEGQTFKIMLKELWHIDYYVKYKVIKACDFNLPQFRERIYIVAFKDEESFNKFQWPEPVPFTFTMSDVLKSKCEKEVGYTIRKGGNGCNINDRHNWQSYKTESGIRVLTIEEMKMMMGFPESFKFPVTKTQAMKQFGNSVAVPVVKAIAEQILKVI